eukprot:COSAG04_NODE_152_length_22459_cov_12.374597_12_plen_201_part_00
MADDPRMRAGNTTIAVTLDTAPMADEHTHVTSTEYSFFDKGGKASLPKRPKVFPWPAPLSAKQRSLDAGQAEYTAQPLTFAIVEVASTTGRQPSTARAPRAKTDDGATHGGVLYNCSTCHGNWSAAVPLVVPSAGCAAIQAAIDCAPDGHQLSVSCHNIAAVWVAFSSSGLHSSQDGSDIVVDRTGGSRSTSCRAFTVRS